MKKTKIFGFILFLLILIVIDAGAATRIALVIGNSKYQSSPLKNPVNDANAIADILKTCGFEVTTGFDMDQIEMKKAINLFGNRMSNGSVALFYYSGHGMQVNGTNFLIPIGAKIHNETDVDIESVNVNRVLAKMASVEKATNILILDACRDNPFSRGFRTKQSGLAYMNAPTGTIVAYSTAPGSIASDGDGQYGIYTEELINFLLLPDIKIEDIFKRVRVNVAQKSKNKQIPWESSSLMGDFYFSIKDNMPPSSKFSLSDLSKEADETERIRQAWIKYNGDMKSAFQQVQKFQEKTIAKEKKIVALNRFISAFNQNNPYSQEDNKMRSNAIKQIEYWKNYKPKIVGGGSNYITIGSTKRDVLRIQGTPKNIQKYESLHQEVWDYGSSSIDFENDRVRQWSNYGNNLKAKMEY